MTVLMIVGAMVFTAGLSYRYLFGLAITLGPLLYIVLASASYRRQRRWYFSTRGAIPSDPGFRSSSRWIRGWHRVGSSVKG